MGILIKGKASDALGAKQHVLPWALVKVHDTNLLGVSLAVCSKLRSFSMSFVENN